MNFNIVKRQFDVVIIGSGGAGLMTALSCLQSGVKNIAVVSKAGVLHSHTVAAKGGINAAFGNVSEDDWRWHAYDTIKGGDYLSDVDAVEILCKNAKEAIIDLEKMGVVFSRDAKGKLAQRAYGGQTTHFGKGDVAHRSCYSKDKTGHTILYSLYENCLKGGVQFFEEFFVSDLLIADKKCYGCLAIDMNQGQMALFESSNVIIASGGYSQIYRNTTSSTICTGDGLALVFKEGLALQDMEFIQFHPTGIDGCGFLITEAARGEGAYLLNKHGQRFMEKYAPKMMELASRDVISRAIATEIYEGRGCGDSGSSIHLDLRHLSDDTLHQKLPGVVELVHNFVRKNGQKIDIKSDLIPISPSAHYTMGGIPTNLDTVVIDHTGCQIEGLMAVGEAACLSVHGANRLGCNSLLDLIVFGKIAGKNAAKYVPSNQSKAQEIAQKKLEKFSHIFASKADNAPSVFALKSSLQELNERNLGVFRKTQLLSLHLTKLHEITKQFLAVGVKNKSLLFNDELIAYLELENLLLNSLATAFCAINRKESRGAHYCSDFDQRNDKDYLHHSVVCLKDFTQNHMEFYVKDIVVTSEIPELNLELEPRNY